MSKKQHRIPLEVKADILKRVKEEGIPVAQAAKDHGIHEATIYNWLGKGASGTPSWSEFTRLQKQIKELLELVGELTLKLSISQKNS
jgi:transposase-like protein